MRETRFTDKERIMIVKLHLDKGRTLKSLSEEFGVSQSTIGRWTVMFRNKALKQQVDSGIDGTS